MALEDVYQRNLHHRTHRAGWLRAAVLGANDGLVSTASLMIGVTAAKAGGADAQTFLITAGAATRHPPPYVVLKGAPGARVLALGAERVRPSGNSVLVFDQVERRRRGAC